jgi:hypothetical protein
VAGSSEHSDEPSCSGAVELVSYMLHTTFTVLICYTVFHFLSVSIQGIFNMNKYGKIDSTTYAVLLNTFCR